MKPSRSTDAVERPTRRSKLWRHERAVSATSGRATSRPGCCRKHPAFRTSCVTTCVATTTPTRSTSSIVGCGAGGGTLAQRLARAGWSVVAFDAGPFWDPETDWVSDERGSHSLYWTDPRLISGADPVPLGSNNSGRGVGGSMVHYAGYTPRFHPVRLRDVHQRRRRRRLADLLRRSCGPTTSTSSRSCRSPASTGRGVTRTATRSRPSPCRATASVFIDGCERLGIAVRVGPVAIANGRFGNRPHCIYRGFCLQGCKVNAKASPLITHVPDALAHGAEIRAHSHVSRVLIDEHTGLATGVTYFKDGVERRQRARLVAIAGYSIETPRLLLLSTSKRFKDGLCNDEGQVGRYVMVQGAPQTAGRFESEVRMYKGPPPEVSTEEFYETDPAAPYRRGFSIQSVSPLPITYAEHVIAQGHWGEALREYMRDYVHWASLGSLCELLPLHDNGVTLAAEVDKHGLPVANFSYSMCDNDKQLIAAAQIEDGTDPAGRRRDGNHDDPAVRASGRRLPHGDVSRTTASSTPISAPSPCRTSTSPTAACCRRRGRPTRR